MAKIFGYELKRLLGSKFTIGFLIVIGAYSYLVMQGEVVFGVVNTAPFSPWSFGVYLAKVPPLLLTVLLFWTALLAAKPAQAVKTLTDAACGRQDLYRLVRCGALAAAFWLLTLVPVAYACWFYSSVFQVRDLGALLAPLVFVILPAFWLVLGLGLWGARRHRAVIWVLLPIVLLAGVLPPAAGLDVYGLHYLTAYPAALGVLDPPFQLTGAQLACKALDIILGTLLILASVRRQEDCSA